MLVGHADDAPFEPHPLFRVDGTPFTAQYAGNLTAARHLLTNYPLNADDRPPIENRAPITHRRQKANVASWFVGDELIGFMDVLLQAAPPERDAYLQKLPEWEFTFRKSWHRCCQARRNRAMG